MVVMFDMNYDPQDGIHKSLLNKIFNEVIAAISCFNTSHARGLTISARMSWCIQELHLCYPIQILHLCSPVYLPFTTLPSEHCLKTKSKEGRGWQKSHHACHSSLQSADEDPTPSIVPLCGPMAPLHLLHGQ